MGVSSTSIAILTFITLQWSCTSSKTNFQSEDFVTGNYSQAAVASNSAACAETAKLVVRITITQINVKPSHCSQLLSCYCRDILGRGGTAVDAAIAALICEGVVNPQNSGIGGGFTMTIYNRSSRKAHTINAREPAPAAATPDLFSYNKSSSIKGALKYLSCKRNNMFCHQ